MTKRLGKAGAIEPTSVEKMPRGYFLGVDPGILGEDRTVQVYPMHDQEYVSPLMRRLGYSRNPSSCGHYRRSFRLGAERWHCADCGETL